jgi:catechol 2,3-dioxygenase-like lactoylglutathione lyase family enzyme
MGLNPEAEKDVNGLISSGHAAVGTLTVFSAVLLVAGALGMASTLQAWYQRIYDQPPSKAPLKNLAYQAAGVVSFSVYIGVQLACLGGQPNEGRNGWVNPSSRRSAARTHGVPAVVAGMMQQTHLAAQRLDHVAADRMLVGHVPGDLDAPGARDGSVALTSPIIACQTPRPLTGSVWPVDDCPDDPAVDRQVGGGCIPRICGVGSRTISPLGVTAMLDSASTHAMIAVQDLSRAKDFYGGKLGLTAADEVPGAGVRYQTQSGTWFLVYRSEFAGTAKSTSMRFEVEDIDVVVKELRDRGIVFEDYDLPGVKTVEGIAQHESGARGAWFKDPDGNILQIGRYYSR